MDQCMLNKMWLLTLLAFIHLFGYNLFLIAIDNKTSIWWAEKQQTSRWGNQNEAFNEY